MYKCAGFFPFRITIARSITYIFFRHISLVSVCYNILTYLLFTLYRVWHKQSTKTTRSRDETARKKKTNVNTTYISQLLFHFSLQDQVTFLHLQLWSPTIYIYIFEHKSHNIYNNSLYSKFFCVYWPEGVESKCKIK